MEARDRAARVACVDRSIVVSKVEWSGVEWSEVDGCDCVEARDYAARVACRGLGLGLGLGLGSALRHAIVPHAFPAAGGSLVVGSGAVGRRGNGRVRSWVARVVRVCSCVSARPSPSPSPVSVVRECVCLSGGVRAHRLPPVGAGCGVWGLRPASCEPCLCRGVWQPEGVGARVSVPVAHGGLP